MGKPGKTVGRKRPRRGPSKVGPLRSTKAFRTYKQAIGYLCTKTNYEREEYLRYNVTTFNLERMEKLLSKPNRV